MQTTWRALAGTGMLLHKTQREKKEQLQPLYHQSISSPPLPVSLSDSGNLNQPMEPQNYLSETPKCTPITNKHVSHYIFFNMHFQFWETSVLPSGKFAFLFCPYHLQTAPYPDIPPSLPPSLGVALLSWGPCPCFPALALPCAWPFRVHITGNLCSQILRSSFLFPPRIAHKVPALCGATRVLFFISVLDLVSACVCTTRELIPQMKSVEQMVAIMQRLHQHCRLGHVFSHPSLLMLLRSRTRSPTSIMYLNFFFFCLWSFSGNLSLPSPFSLSLPWFLS